MQKKKQVMQIWEIEAEKVCKLIEKDKQPTVASSVTLNTLNEMKMCATIVARQCIDTIVILLASVPTENSILIALIIPDLDSKVFREIGVEDDFGEEFMKMSIKTLGKNAKTSIFETFEPFPDSRDEIIRFAELSFPFPSEWVAEKLVDQVRSNAFQYLKHRGLYIEPEDDGEEIAYGFDDI